MKKIRPTCDQCLYHEHCYDLLDATDCAAFKDKDKFVELPCQIGDYFVELKNDNSHLYKVDSIHIDYEEDWTVIGKIIAYNHNVSEPVQNYAAFSDLLCVVLTKEEAQQWLNDHGYDDILIGEMHE